MIQSTKSTTDYDYILVGGGLQSGLVALALAHEQPSKRVLLVERMATLGGNHTWCFHASDIPEAAQAWFLPLIEHEWKAYTVNYPSLSRVLNLSYCGISSEHFHRRVFRILSSNKNFEFRLNTEVSSIYDDGITLASGESITGGCIIDSRGPSRAVSPDQGYQKFVGLDVTLKTGHGLKHPILMDGCVKQTDGLRFFYVLPFAPNRLLIEDTYFSDHHNLDEVSVRDQILKYAAHKGWDVERVEREESGVLPLPWKKQVSPDNSQPGVHTGGYGGGYFHPITGYSLPLALRFACAIAGAEDDGTRQTNLNTLNEQIDWQRRALNRLNYVFFRHYDPKDRWHLMARFYKRPESTIQRFYNMTLSRWDIVRILVGPIPKKMRWTARSDKERS